MSDIRDLIRRKLHETYAVQAYDSGDVWAGNMSVELDGVRFDARLSRAFIGAERTEVHARVRAELYLRDVDASAVRAGDLDAHLWTDADDHGYADERGIHRTARGRFHPMRLLVDEEGMPELTGNNLVFESDPVRISKTGVFNYTVEFSADDKPAFEPSKAWISINDISLNVDGVIAVGPEHVRECPSVAEVCVRKVGAKVRDGQFVSGRIASLTAILEQIPADVIYLLPFFEPGTGDLHTGEDVRKGELGSVYAVKDFYRIDPDLVTPPEQVDFIGLVSEGLIRDFDLEDLLTGRQMARLKRVDDFNNFKCHRELEEWLGRDRLTQIVGRAELRALAQKAHELGKQVIFDLVLMQTSRDCPLIESHPEWYVLDDEGRPKIHQIAWLVYSDVALLDLPFNKPLQNYLSSVAPFWIKTCDLDGVRIDASQTVDRPFLKQIKNRINQTRPDAIVLGETLCALDEASDIPADMVYALLVDFHRDAEYARPYTEFLEQTYGAFAPGTVAIAYFENHDSLRATAVWRERYQALVDQDPGLRAEWGERCDDLDPALVMALLKNLQASVIDLTAGLASRTSLAYALEYGTDWGEEARTDFENPTLMQPELGNTAPRSSLVEAYRALAELKGTLPEVVSGGIFFHRNEFAGGDPDDRVFAYTRYTATSCLLVAHNLDPVNRRETQYQLADLPVALQGKVETAMLFDTYSFFVDEASEQAAVTLAGGEVEVSLGPLQTVVVRVGGK
jgi:glycosidase